MGGLSWTTLVMKERDFWRLSGGVGPTGGWLEEEGER